MKASMAMIRWNILGVNVQVWEQQNAITNLDARVKENTLTKVAFANSNLLHLAASDQRLRDALGEFIVLNDGIGADLAARILYGKAFPCNLNGTDFVPAYLDQTVHNHRIFIVGAQPGIAERAGHVLQQRWRTRHEVVGCVDGYSGVANTEQLCNKIRAARASLLLVGMGCPKQEHWISENLSVSGSKLAFGVGALLDFVAGEVSRAPPVVRGLRLEWAYRLAIEPRRLFRRYVLETPVFLLQTMRQRRRAGFVSALKSTSELSNVS